MSSSTISEVNMANTTPTTTPLSEYRIFVEPQQGAFYEDQLSVAQKAEQLGFGAFFRSDHYHKMGEGSGEPGPTDSWVTLAAIARETSTIRLGTLVTSATFRSPGLLAISVAQVDNMSNGRVDFGLGAGWFKEEHDAYAFEFPSTKERFDRLEEQLTIISKLWLNKAPELVNYHGEFYTIKDSPALPAPTQPGGPPIIIGGVGPKRTPQLAARFASEFNVPFASLETTTQLQGGIDAACADIGRDPNEIIRSAAQVVCIGTTEDELARRARNIGREPAELRENGFAGTPAEVKAKAQQFHDAGIGRIYLQVLDMGDLDHLDLIAETLS